MVGDLDEKFATRLTFFRIVWTDCRIVVEVTHAKIDKKGTARGTASGPYTGSLMN